MSKNGDSNEKRLNARVFFSLEDDVCATIDSHGGTPHSIPVTLLSISTGGLSFMANRYNISEIKEGDRLTLSSIKTPLPLGPIDRIVSKVKYILDFEHNPRLSLGCEFVEASKELISRLDDYTRFRLKNLESEE
jgi:hypothetical protein